MSDKLLEGYSWIEPIAAEVERCTRTIIRWMDEPNGLPYVLLGNRRLVHIATARAWIANRMRNVPRARKSTRKHRS